MKKLLFSKCLVLFMIALCPQLVLSAELFRDGFESGRLGITQSGVSWSASNAGGGDSVAVSSTMKHSGQYSLKFHFAAGSQSDDAWAEQRVNLGSNLTEIWVQFFVYIPTNYRHRSVSPNNNKFLAIYRNPYTSPGFQVNLSLGAEGDGGSRLQLHSYHNGVEQPIKNPSTGAGFISPGDRGKWMEIIAHVKAPTSGSTANGVMQVWKNGVLVANETAMNMYGGSGQNFMNEMYLLGWANSGFDADTDLYIDDIVISSSAIGSNPSPTPDPGTDFVPTPQDLRIVQ